MKKLFSDKKFSKKGFLEFLDTKGFYIVLILCVAIVGTTAVLLSNRNLAPSDENYQADRYVPEDIDEDFDEYFGDGLSDESSVAMPDDAEEDQVAVNETFNPAAGKEDTEADAGGEEEAAEPVAKNTDEPVKKENEADKPETKEPADKKESPPEPKDKGESGKDKKSAGEIDIDVELALPVFGDISFDFAKNKLVYSRTLNEWRTHSGIDIAAARGTQVKAAADGVVCDIKSDPRFGVTIVLDHGDGLKTLYANLASSNMVVPNQIVKKGETIGSVGETAAFEIAEESHLHFEVLLNDEPVNPKDYLHLD